MTLNAPTNLVPPHSSPISQLIATATSSLQYPASTLFSLPLEILHNLQHQHAWTNLTLHAVFPDTHSLLRLPLPSDTPTLEPTHTVPNLTIATPLLISGLPPRHSYIHPDLQNLLLKHNLTQTDLLIQREWIIPLSLADKPSLAWLARVFDALPEREPIMVVGSPPSQRPDDAVARPTDPGESMPEDKGLLVGDEATGERQRAELRWRDGKRVLLAMKGQDGQGGDGTVAYYVCLEGEVKPRQNG